MPRLAIANGPAERAAEFQQLLVAQGHATRSMKYGWEPDEDQRAEIDARAVRLLELAELMGEDWPERFVNERLAAWLRMNPLALTSERIRDVINAFREPNPDTQIQCTVGVQIGNQSEGGYYYQVMADDLEAGHALVIKVPETVAEHFRQQGYRKRSREIASALGFKLDY